MTGRRSHSGGSEGLLSYFSLDILAGTAFPIGCHSAAWRSMVVAILQLLPHFFDEKVIQVLFLGILLLNTMTMLVFQSVQFLQFLLCFFVKLLFYFQGLSLLRSSRRGVVGRLILSSVFALPPCFFRLVELIEEVREIFDGGVFVETEEFFLLDLFVTKSILAHCIFEEIEGIKKVDVGVGVVDVKFIMLFEAVPYIIELLNLFLDLLFFLLENLLEVLSIFLFLLLEQLLQLPKLLSNQLFMDLVGLLDSAFITLTNP